MPYQTERLNDEYHAIREHIGAADLSALNSLDQLYAKVLVISSGSEFEALVSEIMEKFALAGAKVPEITTLIQRKAIDRQYFQNFAWDAKNINKFLSLFGGRVSEMFELKLAAGELSKENVLDFIQMNGRRNELVHRNFPAASADLTPEEAIAKFRSAVRVCDVLDAVLSQATLEVVTE